MNAANDVPLVQIINGIHDVLGRQHPGGVGARNACARFRNHAELRAHLDFKADITSGKGWTKQLG